MLSSRSLLAAAAFAALGGSPAVAADAVKPAYGFSTLKAVPAADAKAKAEAWLKAANKFDQAAFDKVWAADGRTTLDRIGDTLALGHPDAAAVVTAARQADAAPAAEVPAVLKDAKQDPFFRANLALVFARGNAGKKAYEESLEALNGVAPEQVVDPAGYFFFKAVAEHATMKREAATATITRLLDDVADAPDRYKMVATLMFFDMANWSPDPKDMANIERLMDNSGRRLDLSRPGEKTQEIQKKIVFRLDEIIKELESQCKGGQCNGGQCPGGGKPGNKPGGALNPSNPLLDSMVKNVTGAGKVDDRKLREAAEQWGGLTPEKRAAVVEEITRELPAKYKPMIDEYFKALNRTHGFANK